MSQPEDCAPAELVLQATGNAAPTPAGEPLADRVAEIAQSGLFEPAYYRMQLRRRGVSLPDADPEGAAGPRRAGAPTATDRALIEHFLLHGGAAGIAPHPLFDAGAYLRAYPDVAAAGLNPLTHYLRYGFREGRWPGRLFNPRFYTDSGPDPTFDVNPLAHFVRQGIEEGRRGWTPADAERLIAPFLHDPASTGCLNYWNARQASRGDLPEGLTLGLYASSRSGERVRAMRALLAHAFATCGCAIAPRNEFSQPPGERAAALVIAPHEFFYCGKGVRIRDAFPFERAIMVSTAPGHSPQFARALPFLARAAAVVDVDVHAAGALRQLGIDAHFLPLGYAADFPPLARVEILPDVLAFKGLPDRIRRLQPPPGDRLSDRPLDLVFAGMATDRRRRFFARSAEAFSRFNCFLSLDDTTPGQRTASALLDASAVVALAQRSKIVLNVHRDEQSYIEWRRVVHQGIWQRALVVSEPCAPVPGLQAGEHYLECRLSEMPDLVTWLLTTAAGAATAEVVRARGYAALVRDLDLTVWLRALLPRLLHGDSR